MPETYTVKLSDGREFDVVTEGGPPTEAAILASLGQSDAPKAQVAIKPENSARGLNAAAQMGAVGRSVPAAATAAEQFFTSPTLPKTAAAIGRTVGAVAPAAGEFLAGNPAAAIALATNAGKGSWAGGKAGYFTGKLAQSAAEPVAKGLRAAAPYAQGLNTLSTIQGALGLHQMAEPERQDIGTLGLGATVKAGAIPMTPELVAMPVADAVKSLTDAGWPESRAKSYVTQMRKLMNR